MSEIYDKNDVEPVKETSMRGDMTNEDIAKHNLIVPEEKKPIKQCYRHIKEKNKIRGKTTGMLLYKAGDQEVGNSFMITGIFLKRFGVVHLPLTVYKMLSLL